MEKLIKCINEIRGKAKQDYDSLHGRILFLEDHSKDVLRPQLERGKFLLNRSSVKGEGLSISTDLLKGIKARRSASCVVANKSFQRGVVAVGGQGTKVSWGVRFLGPRREFSTHYYMLLGVHTSPSTMGDSPQIRQDRGKEGVYALSFTIDGDPVMYHGGLCEDGEAGKDPNGNERRISVGDEIIVTLDYERGTLSYYHTNPNYCSQQHNLPLDTPLFPYFYSADVDFEIYFVV
jgi:hypothetical protein